MNEAPKRILVAEDNLSLAKVLEFNLKRAGFTVTVAPDGVKAAEAARRETFDLVITDYQMPGMNGEELCQSIRTESINREVPIALCSAKGMEVNVEELSNKYGLNKVFCKPFSPSEIVAFAQVTLEPATAGS
jgi:DNA-binding response OmpR family regulator